MTRGADHMLISEKSQRTQNGTMFVDLDCPLNASRRLSASAELLVTCATLASAVLAIERRLAGWLSRTGIVSKRQNLF